MTPKELGTSLRCDLFADRPSIQEAFDYAIDVSRASDNPPAVMTAIFIVVNTIANKLIEMGETQ